MPIRRILPLLALALAACGESRADDPARKASASTAPPAAGAAQAAAAPREGILLALSAQEGGTFTVDPVAIVTPGGLREPWDEPADSAFGRRYYAPGTRYAVRSAGVAVGEARVEGMMEPQCNERVGRVAFTPSAPLPDGWEGGLASDAFPAPAARRLLRPLSAQEQGELATLADSIHAAHRIPSSARAAGETQSLFAVTVPGVEGPVLAGTFNVTAPHGDSEATYNQLLIAEPRGGVYRPAYVFHGRDDGDTGFRSLLDAADLDGDGVPELVARAMYNEGWGYVILKRGAEGWTEIYSGGGGGGC